MIIMLILYQFEGCPFCAKVRLKLTELQLDWLSKTAPRGSKNREELLKLGGKEQVPFLVDEEKNVKMYESDEIINSSRFFKEFRNLSSNSKSKSYIMSMRMSGSAGARPKSTFLFGL